MLRSQSFWNTYLQGLLQLQPCIENIIPILDVTPSPAAVSIKTLLLPIPADKFSIMGDMNSNNQPGKKYAFNNQTKGFRRS